MAERVGRRHTVAVANGTLAIELILRALEIGPGDEVIVPALTFPAPAMSVLAVGALPVPTDITRDTWTLSPESTLDAITPRTRAVIAVDVLGHPADFDALEELGLPIIEDAAEAHGAAYKGESVGGFGVASAFSFHANKTISTGEGGCVCTDSAPLAERLRVIAHHGMRPERPYVNEVVGRNYRMTNITAAIGLGQLDRWDELVAARNRVADQYRALLDGAACEQRPVAQWARYACWLHTVLVDNRNAVVQRLRDRGIDARGIWPALGDQPVLPNGGPGQPVAREIAARALWLPTSARIADDDIRFVADALREVTGPRQEE
jgi:perosamine synthetase